MACLKLPDHVNGKKYIGQSVNIEKRLVRHSRELKSGKSPNKILQLAWNKYGETNFNAYILENCDVIDLDEREIYFIKNMQYRKNKTNRARPLIRWQREISLLKDYRQYDFISIAIDCALINHVINQ